MQHNYLNNFSQLEEAHPLDISKSSLCAVANHRIRVISYGEDSGYLRVAELDNISFINLGFGAEVNISGPPLGDFYLIHYILEGSCLVEQDNKSTLSRTGDVLAINPFSKTILKYSHDCKKIIIKIDKVFIEDHLRQNFIFITKKPIHFNLFNQNSPEIERLKRIINFSISEINIQSDQSKKTLSNHIQSMIISAFITSIKNNYTDTILKADSQNVVSELLKIEEYIFNNISSPISLDDLLSISGMGKKSIYKLYRKHYNTTPISYIKETRLNTIRNELTNPQRRNITVTDIAMNNGMYHMSNFASEYKSTFGELPSETLKKSL